MAEIRVEKNGFIASVTLSNPGKLNALNVAMWEALADTFAQLSKDEDLRCVTVRGDDQNFAAGADIEEFSTVRSTMAQGIRYHRETIAQALEAIANCIHPTIAAIDGVCVGGGLEIACACDLRIASTTARFGIPVNRLGFSLAPDELRQLLHLVGKAATLEILLEGRVFDAIEAREKGLIQRIASDMHREVGDCAARIAQGAPLAARMNKQLIRRLAPAPEPLSDAEMTAAFAFFESHDYREGVQAFLGKRKPIFSGK